MNTQTGEVLQKQLNMLTEFKLPMSFLAALVNNPKMSIFTNFYKSVKYLYEVQILLVFQMAF